MSYKTIFVCLSTKANAEPLTRIACAVAKKFGGTIKGVHTLQNIEVYPGIALHITSDIMNSFNQAQDEEADKIRQTFIKIAKELEIPHEWKIIHGPGSDAGERLAQATHCADLIIMGQANRDEDRPDQGYLQKRVIEESGRPVLVVPNAGEFETIGENPLVGWSATREATRALHDAIPFLKVAGKSNLLWMASTDKEAEGLSKSAACASVSLEKHGIETKILPRRKMDISVGDTLLNEACDMGADLIVTGAFGHSRFYDFVIGATTTHLLKHMTVPVLFSN